MAPSVVQTASHNSATVTFGTATTGGNCPVVGIGIEATAARTVTAVKLGGAAGNFAQLSGAQATANAGGIFQIVDMWADPNCASGQTAVAITASGSTAAIGGVAWEVSGLAATSATLLDKASSNHATSGTWSSGSTATTTNAHEFWAGVVSVNNTPTGPASPWANTRPGSDAVDMVAGQQVVTSTGTATYSGTGSGIWAAAVVALLPAAAAITGTGSLAAAPMKLALTGGQTFTGTLSVALAPMKLALAGSETFSGQAAVALAPMKLALAGSETFTGTLSMALAPMRLALAGQQEAVGITGTLGVALAPMRLAASAVAALSAGGDYPYHHRRGWKR